MSEQCKFIKADGLRCKIKTKNGEFCRRHTKTECPICFEEIKSDKMILSCDHAFHAGCITRWYVHSDNCPVCRVSQSKDPFMQFKNMVQDDMREKYRDAIESLEDEILRLRYRLTRHERIDLNNA